MSACRRLGAERRPWLILYFPHLREGAQPSCCLEVGGGGGGDGDIFLTCLAQALSQSGAVLEAMVVGTCHIHSPAIPNCWWLLILLGETTRDPDRWRPLSGRSAR